MTPVVTVHGAGLAEPFSKPGVPRSCEATLVLACVQTAVVVQTFARIVVVVPVTLSLSVAVAQSYVTVSGHVFAYQNVSVEALEGSVNVCTAVLSVVGVLMPSCAPYMPLCFA